MLKYQYPGTWDIDGYSSSLYYIHTYPDIKTPGELASKGNPHSCREFFVRSYREKITENDGFTCWAQKAYCAFSYGRPNAKTFNSRKNKLEEETAKGVYITNSFEKAHGWPLTKLHQVECTARGGHRIPVVFLVGPRKWTTSPYLMSIWSLTIRLGRNRWLPKSLLSLDHENLVRQMTIAGKSRENDNGDARQVCTIREWDPFMTLYKDLFGGASRKYHWDKRHLHGVNDRPEGIMRLIQGSTGYQMLANKYKKLKKEKKLK